MKCILVVHPVDVSNPLLLYTIILTRDRPIAPPLGLITGLVQCEVVIYTIHLPCIISPPPLKLGILCYFVLMPLLLLLHCPHGVFPVTPVVNPTHGWNMRLFNMQCYTVEHPLCAGAGGTTRRRTFCCAGLLVHGERSTHPRRVQPLGKGDAPICGQGTIPSPALLPFLPSGEVTARHYNTK